MAADDVAANKAEGGWAAMARTIRAAAMPTRRILVGLFLIAAFAATGAALLLIVTAGQLQNAVEAPEFDTLKISTGWIRQDVAYLEHYWKEMGDISRKEDAAEEELFLVGQRDAKIRADMADAADETRNFIDLNDTSYILPPLKLRSFASPAAPPAAAPAREAHTDEAPQHAGGAGQDADSAAAAPSTGAVAAPAASTVAKYSVATPPPSAWGFGREIDDYFDAYYAELDGAPDADAARKSLNGFKTETYKHLAKYFVARARFDSDASNVRGLNAQVAALEAQATQLDANSQKPGTPLANGAYWSLTEDFLTFRSLVGEDAYNIIALPRMMLVLMLSIFMGILGSLIYITKEFYRDPDARGFWDIVFRIGLGAGVAFALFFFAAAGMLAMEQSKTGAQSEMSPYLIAFLGITGGYLSDRVTQWMREMGENAFKVKGDGPPDRWAVGLAEGLKSAGLDDAALASAAGVTAADAGAWIAMTKPVPGDKQPLVAAFLREHPSKVFTDIAPG